MPGRIMKVLAKFFKRLLQSRNAATTECTCSKPSKNWHKVVKLKDKQHLGFSKVT